MRSKAALFWSGGKDSAYALFNVLKEGNLDIVLLITTLNSEYKRVSMHGIREELLGRQAEAVDIPLQKMWVPNEPTNKAYETELDKTLADLKQSGISHIVFGDIFLEDLKKYRDAILQKHGLIGIYPLWKKDTSRQIQDFLSAGFKTITCCISTTYLSKKWMGTEIDADFLATLPENVDPCGENGEFHTFCFDGPIFLSPVNFKKGEERFVPLTVKTEKSEELHGFWYIDLV